MPTASRSLTPLGRHMSHSTIAIQIINHGYFHYRENGVDFIEVTICLQVARMQVYM